MAALVDTSVLVHRFDSRSPDKQRIARDVLRQGIASDSIRLPHQAVLEFLVAVTRPRDGQAPLMSRVEAQREADALLAQFDVLYPDTELVRLTLHGATAYDLPWGRAHLWAYAERYGLDELLSENFVDGRLYGTVRVVNPFARR